MASATQDKRYSRRSIDWRDSGIVIDEFMQLDSFYDAKPTSSATSSFDSEAAICSDDDGDTILHLAIVGCSLDVVAGLVKICDLNAINNMMQTPLHVATIVNRDDMVSLLLKSRADVTVRDRRGNTALMLACSKGFREVAETILNHIEQSLGTSYIQEQFKLTNFDGQTCLHMAAEVDQRDIIDLLVNKFNIDVNSQDSKSGETIMHKAVRQLNVPLVMFLCQLPIHCNKADYSMKSPIDYVNNMFESITQDIQKDKLIKIKQVLDERIKNCVRSKNNCCSDINFCIKLSDMSNSEDDEDEFDF